MADTRVYPVFFKKVCQRSSDWLKQQSPNTQHSIPSTVNYPNTINPQIFQNSLSDYKTNNLIQYLKTIFDTETILNLINIYKIGTSSHFGGGTTIFWQIDS